MLQGGREMLQGGREMLEGGREITKLQKKGSKGVKIEKSFLVSYTTHIGLPKSEKKFFWFTITLTTCQLQWLMMQLKEM